MTPRLPRSRLAALGAGLALALPAPDAGADEPGAPPVAAAPAPAPPRLPRHKRSPEPATPEAPVSPPPAAAPLAPPVVVDLRPAAPPPPAQVAPDTVALAPRVVPGAAAAALAEGLRARERALHLGRGALVSSAEAPEVRRELPTGESTAIVAVDVDATGAVKAVTFVASTASVAAWERVTRALAARLAGRSLQGSFGAEGARLTLRLEVRQRYPSGHARPIEIHGLGFLFDLADIGASKRRQLHVWIEDERAVPPGG